MARARPACRGRARRGARRRAHDRAGHRGAHRDAPARMLDETRSSISWRLTAPLRLFARRPAPARPQIGPAAARSRADRRPMIVFAGRIREPAVLRAHAAAGDRARRRARRRGRPVRGLGHDLPRLQPLLDTLAAHEDLEALVLVDQDIEIADRDFCAKVRSALADPDVALVGCSGATGIEGPAWWDGTVSAAPLVRRYRQYGGGELNGFVLAPAAARARRGRRGRRLPARPLAVGRAHAALRRDAAPRRRLRRRLRAPGPRGWAARSSPPTCA